MIKTKSYRIQNLLVANFRGITEQRKINISGRHLFLFGLNGFGKSTIVEAIRWCLFGSPAGQQEIEVRNTFCPANTSDVILDLKSQNGELRIQRSLPPGRTESRPVITDGRGKNLLLRDAFPQLARLGQPTGTQVIFAAQHAAGRRQAEISDFTKVLYFYLAIESIPDLLERLRKLAEERRAQREEMAKTLDAFLQELRNELSILQGQKDEILRNPPWGKGQVPTKSETDGKIDNIFDETARLVQLDTSPEIPLKEKISKIKHWNDQLASSEKKILKANLDSLQAKQARAQQTRDEWRTITSKIKETETNIVELNSRRQSLLCGQALNDLDGELKTVEQEYSEAGLRQAIRSQAAIFLEKYHPEQCPVCNLSLTGTTVQAVGDDLTCNVLETRCAELKQTISAVRDLEDQITAAQHSLGALRVDLTNVTHAAESLAGASSLTLDGVETYVQNLENAIISANKQIENNQVECDRRDARSRDLETEERFHYYQEQQGGIEQILAEDISGPRNALVEYDRFLAIVEEVGKLALESFETQIDASTPPLAKEISQVYTRLTAHPSYDGISIARQQSDYERMEPGKLELKVTSARCPGKSFPPNVLNGQAARALQLVPYFVFSDYWHNVMELDLLLVDDPSESFDTSHLDHLMSVLQSVASHTQLVVATHETDRIRPLVEKYFPVEERCIVSVKDFDPLKGPSFDQE